MAKIKQKMAMDNRLLAQKMLIDMLQPFSSKDTLQMMLEIQTLKAKNQSLKDENEELKA